MLSITLQHVPEPGLLRGLAAAALIAALQAGLQEGLAFCLRILQRKLSIGSPWREAVALLAHTHCTRL